LGSRAPAFSGRTGGRGRITSLQARDAGSSGGGRGGRGGRGGYRRPLNANYMGGNRDANGAAAGSGVSDETSRKVRGWFVHGLQDFFNSLCFYHSPSFSAALDSHGLSQAQVPPGMANSFHTCQSNVPRSQYPPPPPNGACFPSPALAPSQLAQAAAEDALEATLGFPLLTSSAPGAADGGRLGWLMNMQPVGWQWGCWSEASARAFALGLEDSRTPVAWHDGRYVMAVTQRHLIAPRAPSAPAAPL
jgi:hypothetical protein